jgi:hypothetical protein
VSPGMVADRRPVANRISKQLFSRQTQAGGAGAQSFQ